MCTNSVTLGVYQILPNVPYNGLWLYLGWSFLLTFTTVSKILWSKWISLLQIPKSVHFHITNMKSISQKCRYFWENCTFTNVITTYWNMISIFHKMTFKLMLAGLILLTNMISIFGKVDDIFQSMNFTYGVLEIIWIKFKQLVLSET